MQELLVSADKKLPEMLFPKFASEDITK